MNINQMNDLQILSLERVRKEPKLSKALDSEQCSGFVCDPADRLLECQSKGRCFRYNPLADTQYENVVVDGIAFDCSIFKPKGGQ